MGHTGSHSGKDQDNHNHMMDTAASEDTLQKIKIHLDINRVLIFNKIYKSSQENIKSLFFLQVLLSKLKTKNVDKIRIYRCSSPFHEVHKSTLYQLYTGSSYLMESGVGHLDLHKKELLGTYYNSKQVGESPAHSHGR